MAPSLLLNQIDGGIMTKKKENELIEKLDGLDGYYFTGEVDDQTLSDDKSLKGELDQYVLRENHSVATNSHGIPDYSMEEDWRDWDKFSNDDFSKASGLTYHDQALEKKQREELISLLNDTLEVESLTVTIIGPNAFVSGRVKSAMCRDEISNFIKVSMGFDNVVNHITINSYILDKGPGSILKQDLGLGGEIHEGG